MSELLPTESVESKILLIQGRKVMIDKEVVTICDHLKDVALIC